MSSGLRTKVFEGHIMLLVQRWIADNPLCWHDQTLDFHRWWQIIMGYSPADASTRSVQVALGIEVQTPTAASTPRMHPSSCAGSVVSFKTQWISSLVNLAHMYLVSDVVAEV